MTLEELGRRAVACKGWRWMPGMRIVNPQRATFGHGRKAAARYCTLGLNDEAFILESKNAGSMDTPSKNEEDWRPDLSDPATLGCLLHLVREWHGYPVHTELVQPLANRWAIVDDEQDWPGQGEGPHGEAAALVMALEAERGWNEEP